MDVHLLCSLNKDQRQGTELRHSSRGEQGVRARWPGRLELGKWPWANVLVASLQQGKVPVNI